MTTYIPKKYTARVMRGVALYLHRSGFATYREDSLYEPGERGIYFDQTPAYGETEPWETLTISPYLSGSGRMNIERTRIQIRMRHVNRDQLEVRDLMDEIRDLLPNDRVFEFGGHFFDQIRQVSATSWVEPDRQDVTESSQNFQFRGNRYPGS